jgi:hypothetical protein
MAKSSGSHWSSRWLRSCCCLPSDAFPLAPLTNVEGFDGEKVVASSGELSD